MKACVGSQVVGLLILMNSSPFDCLLGFLTAPPFMSNCLNLPFGPQGKSWILESGLQETGDQKGFNAQEPHRVPLGFPVI